MDRCTFVRKKDRERSFQTLQVKEAINKDKKGNAFPLGRNKAFRVARAQSTGTEEIEKDIWGLVYHACLYLAVRNHEKH